MNPVVDLREGIHLPKLGGEIIAYRQRRLDDNLEQFHNDFDWEVCFVLRGPDRRYNPARVRIYRSDVPRFADLMEDALKIMRMLERESFEGTYKKAFLAPFCSASIEVKRANGTVSLTFWASTETQTFGPALTSDDVATIVEKLRTLDQKGREMIQSLKALE